MSLTESNEDSGEIDKLLAELENESLSEDSSKFKKENITETSVSQKEIKKQTKPEWADKKDDDYNTYDYQEKEVDDIEW